MGELTLTAAGFAVSAAGMSWRWVLSQPGGAAIDAHDVRLDAADWQYEAFTDLRGWLGHYAEPRSDRAASEERIVGAVGDWVSHRVFGTIASTLVARAPCVVRVVLPAAAADLALLPLDLARVGGRPLAVQQVSLVSDAGLPGGLAARDSVRLGLPERPAAAPLRILGLFSLPDRSAALNVRKEWLELDQLLRELAGAGRAIELRSLQYGTTRARLAGTVNDGGWDVVHLSGHGRAGTFMLEKPDGGRDPVSTGDLVTLLGALRGRVKLVMVSSCNSGEQIARRQLEILTPARP